MAKTNLIEKNNFNRLLLSFIICMMMQSYCIGQNSEIKKEKNMADNTWTQDEQDVKASVEQFLIAAGNYDYHAITEMIFDHANIGMATQQNGTWSIQVLQASEFLGLLKTGKKQPYFESVSQFAIHISDGHLAIVKADAILYQYGIPLSRNLDNFTLLKENGTWKFINVSYSSTLIPDTEKKFNILTFVKGYAQAWCSQNPDFVALFFAEDGTLGINTGNVSIGRTAIAKAAKSFMNTFPDDMIVAFDKLVENSTGIEFHWTLTGTNTEPHGTGKKVNISGYEIWKMDDNGRIKESKGSFDADEYHRQLIYGSDH